MAEHGWRRMGIGGVFRPAAAGATLLFSSASWIACGSDAPAGFTSAATGNGGAEAGAVGGTGGTGTSSGGSSNGGSEPLRGGAPAAGSSGGLVAATGGTTGASGGASGSGGGTGSAGAGGASDAGPTLTGGAGPALDSGAGGRSAGVWCGDQACLAPNRCCFTPGSVLMPAPPGSYACSATPCAATDTEILCDGPEDCGSGQSCNETSTGYACGPSQTTGVIGCGGPQNCPAKQLCCELPQSGTANTACVDSCDYNPAKSLEVCTKSTDCPSANPTCVLAVILTGFQHCQ